MGVTRQHAGSELPAEFPQLCRFLAELSPQPMVAVEGPTHIVRYVNPAFRQLIGREDQNLVGRPFSEAVPEGMANGCGPLLDRVFATASSESLAEQVHGLRDGDQNADAPPSYWSYLAWAILAPDAPPQTTPKPVVGVMIQVTETTEVAQFRRASAAINQALLLSGVRQHELMAEAEKLTRVLRESADRFRFLAESMPQKIFTATPDGDVDYFNGQWIEFTGLTFEQIKGWGWKQFIHPDDVAENIRAWKHSIDSGAPFQFEHRFRRHDGVYRWHLSRAHCMLDADGNGAMWIGSNTDIDDFKRNVTELRQSQERLQAMIAQTTAGIVQTDLTGQFLVVNHRFCEIVGRSSEQLLAGMRMQDCTHPDDVPGNLVLLRCAVQAGESFRLEKRYLRPGGAPAWASTTVTVIKDASGAPDSLVAVVIDINDRKAYEREREALLANEQASRMEAEAANRAKDMFLATLSHEMRTPLNAIVGWVGILRQAGRTEADLEEGLDVIDRNTRAQVQLIDDVLDVSRIISGKLRLEIRPSNLIEITKAGIDVVRPAADAKTITIDARFDASAGQASCDAARIQQVVWNLLSNAIKFTPAGGKVIVSLTRERSILMIKVADTGQGMSTDLLPYVFDRFRQADSSTKRRFGGLGLGLSIVKQLVEMHGGTVEAHSDGQGTGSTFVVRLPIRAIRIDESDEVSATGDEFDAAPASHMALVRLDGVRVLVVDDEADARRLLIKVLEQTGAIITAVASVADAMNALPEAHPDVLVSDLGMPDADGFDLIQRVRAAGYSVRDLPAVALSAFVQKEDQRQALLAGFQVHMPKPVDPHDLTVTIASLAGRTG